MKSYKYLNYTKNDKGYCRITDRGQFYNQGFKSEKELEKFIDGLGKPIYSHRLLSNKEKTDFWRVVENEIGCTKEELVDILIELMYADNELLTDVKFIANHPHYFHV